MIKSMRKEGGTQIQKEGKGAALASINSVELFKQLETVSCFLCVCGLCVRIFMYRFIYCVLEGN